MTNNQVCLRSFVLVLALTLSSLAAWSQSHTLKGRITDKQNLQPLAFVNVLVNNGATGCMSDIDGHYEITSPVPITQIRVSCLGYQAADSTIDRSVNRLNFALSPMQYELSEVMVTAGKNPAHRIIDSVMAHRAENNPDNLKSYSYSLYEKMAFTIDSTNLNKAKTANATGQNDIGLFSAIINKNDLMVMESTSDVLFKSPDKKKQNVTGTRLSGVHNPTVVYLASSLQSVSFYEEQVSIARTQYTNPISKGSKRRYFFNIESVVPYDNGDSLYIISFRPRKDQNFKGLKGSLYINSDGWALQCVKASPSESAGFFTANIQQLYEKVDGQWFPKQFNINLTFPSMVVGLEDGTFSPLTAIGKSYVSNICLNQEIDKRPFSELAIEVAPDAAYRDEAFWETHRIDSLNKRTIATYRFIDSITQDSDFVDKIFGMSSEIANTGNLPLGKINLNLNQFLNISMYRGFYIGLGLSTNRRLSRIVSINAFGGYWTRPKEFDYGGGIHFNLYPRKQTELSLNWFNKPDVIGAFNGLDDPHGMLDPNNYKYQFFENQFARKKAANIQFSSRVGRYLKAFLTAEMASKRYLEPFYANAYDNSERIEKAHFITTELRLRYAYNEKFISSTQGLQSLGTTYPVVWFGWQHSYSGIWDCPYTFDKLKIQVEKHFYTQRMGVSSLLLQAGLTTETAPVVETFDLIGSKIKMGLYAPTSFSTMIPDEFFCDRFAALFLSHHFGGLLWHPDSKWFKPQLVLITNLGWGDMRRVKDPSLCNFKTMEKGYYESGFVVDGLLDLSLTKLGAGLFYRYGPYSFDKIKDNLAIKWSVIIEL